MNYQLKNIIELAFNEIIKNGFERNLIHPLGKEYKKKSFTSKN